MDKVYFWILAVSFFSCVFATIKITELRVPEAISLDDNITDAEFDCIYEAVNETDIEVKWFFNGVYQQIYQWVPGYSTKGSPMGMLKNRTDLDYMTTDSDDTRYRGFKINNISQDLTGNYTCKVSSNYDEASDTKQLTIYSPADTGLDIILLNNAGLVICTVYGISPKPEVDFYILAGNGSQIDINEEVENVPDSDGLYNTTATHDFTEYNHTLKDPTKFVCNISIPGTPYFLTKELEYLAVEEIPVINVTVAVDEINVTRNEIPMEIFVSTTPRGNSASSLQVIGYIFLLSALLLLWK